MESQKKTFLSAMGTVKSVGYALVLFDVLSFNFWWYNLMIPRFSEINVGSQNNSKTQWSVIPQD